jgi:hypothetical protein
MGRISRAALIVLPLNLAGLSVGFFLLGIGCESRLLRPRRALPSASVARQSWSAGTMHQTHDWSPAIGTALKAGYRWLDVYCGGCRQVKPVDLASVDIHPQACLTSLILLLRCRQCGGHGPLPQLVGLSRSRRTASPRAPRSPIRGVPNTAEAAMAPGARATAAFGPTNNAWPRSRATAAIAKPTRCTAAPNQG